MAVFTGGFILVLAWGWVVKLLLIITIVMAAIFSIAQHVLRILPWSVLSLNINIKHEVQLMRRDGVKLANVSLHKESVATEYLTILRYHSAEHQWWQSVLSPSLVILPDMLSADDFRRLRIWLRWKAHSINIENVK